MGKTTYTQMTEQERLKQLKKLAETDKEFIRFLKENKAVSPYFRSLREYTREKHSSNAVVSQPPLRTQFISTAFPWVPTKEGLIFWTVINDKWYEMTLKTPKSE